MADTSWLSPPLREFVDQYQSEFNRRMTDYLKQLGALKNDHIRVSYLETRWYGLDDVVSLDELGEVWGRSAATVRKRITEFPEKLQGYQGTRKGLTAPAACFLYSPVEDAPHRYSVIPLLDVLDELLLSPKEDKRLVQTLKNGVNGTSTKRFLTLYDILHQNWALAMVDRKSRMHLLNGTNQNIFIDGRPLSDVFRDYWPKVYNYLLHKTKDVARAEDLASQVFEKVLQYHASYTDGTNFNAWIMRIATNTFINDYRRRALELEIFDCNVDVENDRWHHPHPEDPERLVQEKHFQERIEGVMETLPEGFVQTAKLRYLGGLSYKEIAERLGIPVGTVMSRLHRAMKRIKPSLEQLAA